MAYGQMPKVINDIVGEGLQPGEPVYPPWSPTWNEGIVQPTPPKKALGGGSGGGGFASLLSGLMGRGFQSQADQLTSAPMPAPSTEPTDLPMASPGLSAPTPLASSMGGAKSRGVSPALSGVMTGTNQPSGGNTIQALLSQLLKRPSPAQRMI